MADEVYHGVGCNRYLAYFIASFLEEDDLIMEFMDFDSESDDELSMELLGD